MGGLTSRQRPRPEEVDLTANHHYHYPPKSGSYFGRYFIMGGERFDTPQPEAYLFGENADLNFLGSRPTPFPYPAPQPNEPTKTLKSLVNIRKESLRFVKVAEVSPAMDKDPLYNVEFVFDTDVRCSITIMYFCTEEVSPSGVTYTPRNSSMSSETYHYKRGANQVFSQSSHIFDPGLYSDDQLNYCTDKEILPIVIQCVVVEGEEPRQSHITIAVVEKNSDGSYSLKALKQKQFVDGLCYLLQEIYGIENKHAEHTELLNDDEIEDNGSECVICMCDLRDTLILPCRHLCLCNGCADSLRYQANNCPICRAPFRALLQIRALRRITSGISTHAVGECLENIPQGYEPVSLIEALNGPLAPAPPPPVLPIPPLSTPAAFLQDAVTSPSCPTPLDSARLSTTREDCAAQTDGPIETSGPLEVSLSFDSATSNHNPRRLGRRKAAPLLDQVTVIRDSSSHPNLGEQTLLTKVDMSLSTPDCLHLCRKESEENNLPNSNPSPGGEESDYYTPEDPSLTILNECVGPNE